MKKSTMFLIFSVPIVVMGGLNLEIAKKCLGKICRYNFLITFVAG